MALPLYLRRGGGATWTGWDEWIDIASFTQFGQLAVTGSATLDGTLNVSLLEGFTPQSGDHYQIMDFASRSGDFANKNGFDLGNGNAFSEQFSASSLTLAVNQSTQTTFFTGLSAPSITYGASSTTLAGSLSSGTTQLVSAGETVQVTLNGVSQNATLDSNDNFSINFDTATLAVSGSPYTITVSYAGDANFDAATGSSALTVTPYALSYSIGNDSQTYGSPANLASDLGTTINTGVNAENLDITYSSTGDTGTAHVAGSPYAITGVPSDGTGKLSDYMVTLKNGALTVNPYAFTYQIGNDSQTYGSPANLASDLGTTINTGVNGENLDITYSSTGDTGTAHVAGSPYAVTGVPSDGTGKLSDYMVTLKNGALTVNPYAFTYQIGNDSQTYGSPANLASDLGTTINTGVNGEKLDIAYASSGETATAKVGAYAISGMLANGTGLLSSYAITLINGMLTVSPAALTITANNLSKTYGQTVSFAGNEFTTSGLLNDDTVTQVTLSSAGAPATATVAGSPYAITPSAAVGSGLGNYIISYANGSLTVHPESPLVISATSGSGQSTPFGAGFALPLVVTVTDAFGDVIPGVSVTFTTPGSGPSGTLRTATATTGENGQASETVTANGIAGSYQITAAISEVAMPAAFQLTNLPATISGTVFQDININGVQDPGEPGLAGQTVFLDLSGSGTLETEDPTTTTDSNGNYQFTISSAGTYTVRQVLPGGVPLRTPASGDYQLTLTSGVNVAGQNFAEVPTSIIVPLTLPLNTPFPKQGNANADFIEAIYRTVLSRDAEPGGLAYWTNLLNSRALSRLQVVQEIWGSVEHLTQEVTDFYFTLLDRAPDPRGLQSWVQAMQNGLTEEQVAYDFLDSPEYLSKGDKYFVDHMYQSLLGRTYDAAGEAYWLNALGDDLSGNATHAPSLTHGQVVTDFLYSPESLNRLVEGYYQVVLQRLADPQGLNDWLTALQQGAPFSTIDQEFLSSDEFYSDAAAHG